MIVVTGVTRGLGRAMTRGFAALGHRVVGCGRGDAELDALRRELGAGHRFDVLDLASAETEGWVEDVLSSHGPPDLLINNAAQINQVEALWRVPVEEFENILEVNVGAVFRVCRAFLPAMIERGSGVIVNFSSAWGRSVSAGVAPYCASKYAIEGLTLALAQELPGGLAAVPVNPGIIDTDMLRTAWAEDAAAYPRPEQWAERAVPFLLAIGPRHNGKPLTIA